MSKRNVTTAVSVICNTCSFHSFDCERKDWSGDYFAPAPRLGSDTVCPMMQFEAVEDADKRPYFERLKDGSLPQAVTYEDTWHICEACSFSESGDGEISIDDCYEEHCLDCPCKETREGIAEAMAEAMS